MSSFSERMGLSPNRVSLGQTDSMDNRLRSALWNFFDRNYWRPRPSGFGGLTFGADHWKFDLFVLVWDRVLGQPVDSMSGEFWSDLARLRDWYFKASWYQVYDLVEFVIQHALPTSEAGSARDRVSIDLNLTLEREGSGYRLIDRIIAPVSGEREREAVTAALESSLHFGVSRTHLDDALALLSNRDSPNFRNSIKESISAVEAAVGSITGEPKAPLGKGLKLLGLDKTHPALRDAWAKLYGWTSDGDGIRHALMDDSSVGLAEARYMLVVCSAFISYLADKQSAIRK